MAAGTTTITVAGRAVGSRRPLFADFSVPVPPAANGGDGGLTLRQLVARVVAAEVDAFRDRQDARRLDRVLSPTAIAQGIARGKVDPAAKPAAVTDQTVDTDAAVAHAWQAFEDGIYLVLIDDVEHRDLDAQVYLRPDSRLTFIRLVFLAGA